MVTSTLFGLGCGACASWVLEELFIATLQIEKYGGQKRYQEASLSERVAFVAKMVLTGMAIGTTVGGVMVALPMLAFTATPSYSLLIHPLAFGIIGLVRATWIISDMREEAFDNIGLNA